MDPQHHHQWRPRPPIPAHLCPICSISHFPFCPPFPQNPIFPPDPAAASSFPRPNLDPYSRPAGAPPPPPPWQRNPTLPHPNFHAFAPPPPPPSHPQPPPPPPPYDDNGNGYVHDGDRSFKRPRIDDFGSGSGFGNPSFSDDARRLKLIHDHGGSCNQVSNGVAISAKTHSNNNVVVNNDHFAFDYIHGNEPQHSQLNNPSNQYRMPPPPQLKHDPQGGYFRPHPPALRPISGQPPLPVTPPPPLPSKAPPTLFPVRNVSSPVTSAAYQPSHEAHQTMPQPPPPPYFYSKPFSHASTGYVMEFPKESRVFHQTLPKQYAGEGQPFPQKSSSLDKPKVVDALHLFKQPNRVTRPDHFVIILRGLPGSGKSYLAKLLRDLEVENGGGAPRIHSMDDYFMTEVEKVEESDASKSSSRGKKPVVKKVMEYCYEPEMQEAYKLSMLKAFKKTLEDGVFTFVIVDDRNLRVAEFAQFWATAKSSGYEVYILEAPYKDPAGCAARNVHGFTQEDIQKMAEQWEESPSIYLQLDAKSLFHGDDLKESGIQEVDMDTEDADNDVASGLRERKQEKTMEPPTEDNVPDGSSKGVKSLDADEDHQSVEVKELGRSKWSEIIDEDDTDKAEEVKGNALSGLIQAYHKEVKSVCWSDQVGNTGFSITAAKKANISSLVIGPGAGYNLRSNPLPEEENSVTPRSTTKPKRQNVFQDQLRAEHESFKAVFDRRRHRIGGLDLEDE